MEIAVYPGAVPNGCAQGADFTVFGKHAGRVRYGEDEKNAESLLYRVCAASKQAGVTFALADTCGLGKPKRSVLVAEGGRLLGITDEQLIGAPFRGKNFRVYATSVGNIGVLSGEDLYAYEPMRALTLCGAGFIVHLASFRKRQADTVAGALAYLNGVPVLSVAAGVAALYDKNGDLLYASPMDGARLTYTQKIEEPY